ncbi:glycosyltransferase [Chitinivibrio alkaliphilus]|uniref:Glycosyl transferase group 1 n=1 Tax=Chitinivibrio alkaliphilus ACht1 TaxID=1313304 RepID=U7D732_9BACT|nr:glycosyltransferase [Chitinivibrio alkaliphilus]ERP30887.1 glycosyl transferase group 1 [Chitinivibrio alkaliphilus ACht1]
MCILLYTGRISKDKNIDFLINVFRQYILKNPKTALFMIGDGPYRKYCEEVLSGYTTAFFPGRLPRKLLQTYYSAADFFLFPSTTDTFGMSVLEALSCGLPTLCSPIGGPAELVRNRELCATLPLEEDRWVKKIDQQWKQYSDRSITQVRQSCAHNMSLERGWEEVVRNYSFVREQLWCTQTKKESLIKA